MSKANKSLFVGGRNAAKEALEDPGQSIRKVYLLDGVQPGFAKTIQALAARAGTPVQTVPRQKMDRLEPGLRHQGVILEISPVDYLDVDDMLRDIAPTRDDVVARKPLVLVLDHIQDPHNMGAVVRSGAAFGVSGIVIPDREAAPVSAVVIKTSAGTALRMPFARVGNLGTLLEQVRERGYWTVGLDQEATETIWDMDWDRPLVLVVGSEGKGLNHAVRKQCDHIVSIPMNNTSVESLNASVAAGIVLAAASKVRTAS